MKQNYTVLICLIFISINSIFGQIVNEGVFRIEENTKVYFGNEYTNKNGANHNNDGDLHLNNNFINNGTTSVSTSGTTYFDSAVNTIQHISGSSNESNFYNLEVNLTNVNKKGVSVADNFGLFVTNTVALTSGDLRLVGEAQLIQTNDVTNSGSGSLLRDQQGVSSTYGYNYWSSPVNNSGSFKLNGGFFDGMDADINSFTPTQILFNSGSPYNGAPSIVDGSGSVTTAATINESWLYTFSRNTIGYAGWESKNKNSEIEPGVGYTMKGTGATDQNYTFKGTPNNGAFTFAIDAGESVLLGNPYPSAIDISEFIKDNNGDRGGNEVFSQIYFWVDGGTDSHYLSNYLGGYATRAIFTGAPPSVKPDGIGGLGTAAFKDPGPYLAVGQGFFVDPASGTGDIVFKNSQRIFKTEGVDSEFYKTAKKSKLNSGTTNLLENSIIRVGYRDPEGFHRQIVLGFVPDSPADINYNPGYDALMLGAREDELFFIIENDLSKKYVIEGVGSYDDSYKIPLGLMMSEEGEHSIMLDAVENFYETVYVFDKVLNTTHNLNESNFIVDLPTGDYLDRFELVFKLDDSEKTLGVYQLDIQNFNVYYNGDNNIVINNQNNVELNQVQVYNTVGQQLIQLKGSILQQENNLIPFNYPKGVYLVIVESINGKKAYKIIN